MANGYTSWRAVTYQDLELLDLSQESTKTAGLFLINLILMIVMLFMLVGIFAITMIVYFAGDEVDLLMAERPASMGIFAHNMFQFLTLFPTILVAMQVLINVMLILQENEDEVFFYIRDNSHGIQMLKGVFGLSLLLLTCMLGYKLSETEDTEEQISFRHIAVCIMSCFHALSMLWQG